MASGLIGALTRVKPVDEVLAEREGHDEGDHLERTMNVLARSMFRVGSIFGTIVVIHLYDYRRSHLASTSTN